MQPIFDEVMDGVTLPKPWQPTHMKSYAKGRAPFRVWTKMVTNLESARHYRAKEIAGRKKMDALIRKIAKETRLTQRAVREYVIAHANEIFARGGV